MISPTHSNTEPSFRKIYSLRCRYSCARRQVPQPDADQADLDRSIRLAQAADTVTQRVLSALSPPFQEQDGLLYHHSALVVPSQECQLSILQQLHDGPLGGHSGVWKTIQRIRRRF